MADHSGTREPDAVSWYWCLRHERPEEGGRACAADHRLGPYPSRQEAEGWRHEVEARNEEWDEEDRRWEGAD